MNGEDHKKCGSTAGWNQHKAYRTPVCDPCRAANTAYARQYRRTRGITTGVLVPLPLLRRAISEASEPLATQLRSLLGGYAHVPRPGDPGHAERLGPPGTPPSDPQPARRTT